VLVKPEWLRIKRTKAVKIVIKEIDLLEEVKKSKVKNNKVIKAMEEIKQAGVKVLRDKEWREEDGIIYKKEKVYMPKDEKLRAEIIRLHHDMPIGGHGGSGRQWNWSLGISGGQE